MARLANVELISTTETDNRDRPSQELADGGDALAEGLAGIINDASLSNSARSEKKNSERTNIGILKRLSGLFGTPKVVIPTDESNISRKRTTFSTTTENPPMTALPGYALAPELIQSLPSKSLSRPDSVYHDISRLRSPIQKQQSNGRRDLYDIEVTPTKSDTNTHARPSRKKPGPKPKTQTLSKLPEDAVIDREIEQGDGEGDGSTQPLVAQRRLRSQSNTVESPKVKRTTRSRHSEGLEEPSDWSKRVERNLNNRPSDNEEFTSLSEQPKKRRGRPPKNKQDELLRSIQSTSLAPASKTNIVEDIENGQVPDSDDVDGPENLQEIIEYAVDRIAVPVEDADDESIEKEPPGVAHTAKRLGSIKARKDFVVKRKKNAPRPKPVRNDQSAHSEGPEEETEFDNPKRKRMKPLSPIVWSPEEQERKLKKHFEFQASHSTYFHRNRDRLAMPILSSQTNQMSSASQIPPALNSSQIRAPSNSQLVPALGGAHARLQPVVHLSRSSDNNKTRLIQRQLADVEAQKAKLAQRQQWLLDDLKKAEIQEGMPVATDERVYLFGAGQDPASKPQKWTLEEMTILVDGLRTEQGPDRYEKIRPSLPNRNYDEIYDRAKYFKAIMVEKDKEQRQNDPEGFHPPLEEFIQSIGFESKSSR